MVQKVILGRALILVEIDGNTLPNPINSNNVKNITSKVSVKKMSDEKSKELLDDI